MAAARGYAISAGAQTSRIWNRRYSSIVVYGGGSGGCGGQRLSALMPLLSAPSPHATSGSSLNAGRRPAASSLSSSSSSSLLRAKSFHCSSAAAVATAADSGLDGRRLSLNKCSTLKSARSAAKSAAKLSTTAKRYSSGDSKMSSPPSLAELLTGNDTWATTYGRDHPSFFSESAKGQSPKVLWLGCSDSRVPESTILNLPPGAVFTHRNIANIFTSADISSLSVIEYAVAHVGVQHVVVCGHTACGGVAAALANRHIGVIDAWLQPLRALRGRLLREGKLSPDLDPAEKSLRLVEENVREGVRTVRSNPNVIKAARDRGVTVHGLVYDLGTGKLRELGLEEDKADVDARIEACTVE